MVINCILYLQSYPQEIELDYLPVIPKKILGFGKVATTPNQAEYRKIQFCGRNRKHVIEFIKEEIVDEKLLKGATSEMSVHRSLPPHKRRAHLRKQRYGKKLEQWRYVWIKETTIHKEKYQPSNGYRIYEVESSE